MIEKRCDMHGIKISKYKISSNINQNGKKTSIITSTWKEYFKGISEKGKYIVSNLFKVKTLVTRENSQVQKSIAKSLNVSVAIINKTINQDLQHI